ncbi:hypothetical protein CV102_09250 [Natronococcus pandeyae]|uniref:Uncharacterized protein n=1 Tax=Natronococcus pandeyae TaxID=2055836 RepID=A0A8J8TSE1_9EURY|nr:hypothetical protein [Natronococcus pandeyae]TYL38694.1 hypothetical protein CV102_09250 [Natronococcus pandeyae]
MMTASEEPIARFTRWLRQRPNSIEFWELVVTDERLVWCYVGQSYRSMLLRADMGERDRALVEDSRLEELEGLAEENFAVPLENLESIRHVEGTRFRRAKLEIEWVDEEDTRYDGRMTLVSTSEADPQAEVVAALEEDPRLDHVDVEIETRRWPFL